MSAPYALPLRSTGGDGGSQCSFMRLPTEIRLQIYTLLVLPRQPTDLLPSYAKIHASSRDYYDYDKKQDGTDRPATANLTRPTLLFRTIEGTQYPECWGQRSPHIRSTYSVRADRFRARCMNTTYHVLNNPHLQDHMGIMRTCKQIHAEVAELLYGTYTFDFDTHIEAIIPFLQDLTPLARSCIKSIRIVKRALPYEKEFDRAEWSSALRYISNPSSNLNLRRLELGIVAGRPGENGWDGVPQYSARDFDLLKEQEGMQWMLHLLDIKGLQELDVSPVIEHCPPGTNSTAMASYIRFSASVASGFADFLTSCLL